MEWLSRNGLKIATRGCWGCAFALLTGIASSHSSFGEDSSYASRQIDLQHATPVTAPQKVRSDADEDLMIPRPPADESPIKRVVYQDQQPKATPAPAVRRKPVVTRTSHSTNQNRTTRASQPTNNQPQPLFGHLGSSKPASVSRRPSVVRQAAHGQLNAAPIPNGLQPASYYGQGPSCGIEASCGCDGPVCSCEPACGAEGYCSGSCGGTCGGGPGGIFEPACGVEGFACGQPGCDSCGSGVYGASCGVGPGCGTAECVPLFLPILPINWCRFEFFAGVQGFTGAPNFAAGGLLNDRSGAGSFGFHEGLNESRSLKPIIGIDWGAQLGFRTTQNNLEKTPFSNDQRNQVFVTGGFFRRVDYGLQMGMVMDYLSDDWYYNANLAQLRGEFSWKTGTCHEFGYRFTGGVSDSSSRTALIDTTGATVMGLLSLEATDQHRFFYRRDLGGDGYVDGFIGTTDNDDTLFGIIASTPMRGRWGLRGGFTYLNPGDGERTFGVHEENWNVSMSVVWRPCGATGKCDGYNRPLFNVADNGTFLVDTQ